MAVLTAVIVKEYVRVPDLDVAIAKRELYPGLGVSETHHKLEEAGLFMPTPAIMIQHYTAVKATVENDGILKYYDGEPVTEAYVDDLYRRIVLGQKGGVWMHLDALFVNGFGAQWLDMVTDHRAIMNGKEKQIVAWKRQPLLLHVQKRVCYVDPVFNKQGLPTTLSDKQDYVPSKNLLYIAPFDGYLALVEGRVARFNAYSKMVILDYDEAPRFTDKRLGVLACISLQA